MRIFITGATGYIGQRVMARVLNQGHEIHALCRRQPDGELFNNPRVKIFKGDVVNFKTVSDAIADCDQAYHIAAYSRTWAKDVKIFFVVQFDRPYDSLNGWQGRKRVSHVSRLSGDSLGVAAQYDVKAGDVIQMKIGISYTNVENARAKLQREVGAWNFDTIKNESKATWNDWLGNIKV